jgi:hypothetical protein
MKKAFAIMMVATVLGTAVWAQEAKNTVTGGFMLGLYAGGSLDYERVLVENFLGKGKFAIGAEAAFGSYAFLTSLAFADVQAKWYPWSGKFYADLGLGFGNVSLLVWSVPVLVIPVGVGWKIDIGKPDGWILDTGAGLDFLAFLDSDFISSGDSSLPMNPRASIQIGYAF